MRRSSTQGEFSECRRAKSTRGRPAPWAGREVDIEVQNGVPVVTLKTGVAAWVVFAFWAHRWLIGVGPFG